MARCIRFKRTSAGRRCAKFSGARRGGGGGRMRRSCFRVCRRRRRDGTFA